MKAVEEQPDRAEITMERPRFSVRQGFLTSRLGYQFVVCRLPLAASDLPDQREEVTADTPSDRIG